jgi:hypothetical protein
MNLLVCHWPSKELLACSVKMSGSKPKLKVRTLDEMF